MSIWGTSIEPFSQSHGRLNKQAEGLRALIGKEVIAQHKRMALCPQRNLLVLFKASKTTHRVGHVSSHPYHHELVSDHAMTYLVVELGNSKVNKYLSDLF